MSHSPEKLWQVPSVTDAIRKNKTKLSATLDARARVDRAKIPLQDFEQSFGQPVNWLMPLHIPQRATTKLGEQIADYQEAVKKLEQLNVNYPLRTEDSKKLETHITEQLGTWGKIDWDLSMEAVTQPSEFPKHHNIALLQIHTPEELARTYSNLLDDQRPTDINQRPPLEVMLPEKNNKYMVYKIQDITVPDDDSDQSTITAVILPTPGSSDTELEVLSVHDLMGGHVIVNGYNIPDQYRMLNLEEFAAAHSWDAREQKAIKNLGWAVWDPQDVNRHTS